MNKRAAKKIEQSEVRARVTVKPVKPSIPSVRSVGGPGAALRSLIEVSSTREFTSREQALDFFIDSLVSRLEGDPVGQKEMKGFLRLLLDTDPILREELVRSVKIRG